MVIGHCDLDLGHRTTEYLPLEYIGFDINGPDKFELIGKGCYIVLSLKDSLLPFLEIGHIDLLLRGTQKVEKLV